MQSEMRLVEEKARVPARVDQLLAEAKVEREFDPGSCGKLAFRGA